MAQKKVQRARVTRKKDTAVDMYLNLAMAIFNKRNLKYTGHESLFYAILSYQDCCRDEQCLLQYMNQCVEYDKKVGNSRRVKQWQELQLRGMSVEELQDWAYKQYKEELNRLINEIKNLKEQQKKGWN